MMQDRQLAHRLRRYGNGLAAMLASALVLGLLAAGHGTIPALGPALVPGHGAWAPNATDSSRTAAGRLDTGRQHRMGVSPWYSGVAAGAAGGTDGTISRELRP